MSSSNSRSQYAKWTFIALILTATTTLDAQTFQRTLGGPFDDRPYCIDYTSTGGYIIAGERAQIPVT